MPHQDNQENKRKRATGRLFRRALHLVFGQTGTAITQIQSDLAERFSLDDPATIQTWYLNGPPVGRIADVVDYIVKHGHPGRNWLKKFVEALPADHRIHLLQEYDLDQGKLLDHYYPVSSSIPTAAITSLLPRRNPLFRGRAEEKAAILELLISGDWPIVTITGLGGSGKTALAMECAHDVMGAGAPFARVVFLTAGVTPLSLDDAVAKIVEDLDLGESNDPKVRLARLRHALGAIPTLLVADNLDAMEDELLRFLNAPPGASTVLATARRAGLLDMAYEAVHLEGLAQDEMADLITSYATAKRLYRLSHPDPASVGALHAATEGHPLAIILALGSIAERGGDLRSVAAQWRAGAGGLVEGIFAETWRFLAAHPAARAILLALPLFPESASNEALAATTGLSGEEFDVALARLVRMSLIGEQIAAPGESPRWVLHHLVRTFIVERRWPGEAVEVARQREAWAVYCLDLSRRVLCPSDRAPGYWQSLATRATVQQLAPEWPTLRAALAWAEAEGRDDLLRALFLTLVHFLDRRFLVTDRRHYATLLLEKADRHGWELERVALRIDTLGWSLMQQEEYEAAERQIEEGLSIARGAADSSIGEFLALGTAFLAQIALRRGDQSRAVELIGQALADIGRVSAAVRRRVQNIRASVLAHGIIGTSASRINGRMDSVLATFFGPGQDGGMAVGADDLEESLELVHNAIADAIAARSEYQSDNEPWEPRLLQAFLHLARGVNRADEDELAEAEGIFHEVLRAEGDASKEAGLAWYGLGGVAMARNDTEALHESYRRALEALRSIPDYRPQLQVLIRAHLNNLGQD